MMTWVVVRFGLRVRPVEREIPSTSLRAGSSLRLKTGYAQDDKSPHLHRYHNLGQVDLGQPI